MTGSAWLRSALRTRPLVCARGNLVFDLPHAFSVAARAARPASLRMGFSLPVESRIFFAAFIGVVILVASFTHRFIELPGKRRLMPRALVGREGGQDRAA